MSYRCQDVVWDYVRPSSSFQNTGTYAPPSTPRVHAFAAVPRTEPADCKSEPPVGGIGTDVCRGRRNPYRGGLGSFHLRFTYLREGGHQVSRSPGPGSYETRHVTGGALVKRPKTASPCFRRPGGRLHFDGGGTWHEETPLKSAERRGTVRASVKTQAQHYSLSFRSKADRLVVNKPTKTTHEGIGPGCYDVSKDGRSVGVKTEKRVVRGGRCAGRGSTNQFLVDWRAYMKRPPKVSDGYGDCGCVGSGGTNANHRGKPERSPTPAPHNAPKTPNTVSYTLKSQSERWPAAKKRVPVAANRRRRAGGPALRLGQRGQTPPRAAPPQHHRYPEEKEEEEEEEEKGEEESYFPRQPPQHSSSPFNGRAKRPASAIASTSLRIPSTTEPHPLSNRYSGLPRRRTIGGGGGGSSVLGGGSGGDCSGSFAALSSSSAGFSGAPQFVPRPPSADAVSRPRAASSPASAASRCIDNSADSCCRGDGRQSGGGRGAAEVCSPRANIPLGKPGVEKHAFSGTNSSPGEAVHRATRVPPPTAKSSRSEKDDVAGGSEQPPDAVEDGAPPALAFQQPQPPVNGTVQNEDLREDGSSSGKSNSISGTAVASKPTVGSQGDAPTVPVVAATISCPDTGHCSENAGRRAVDTGVEGTDQATIPPPSSGLSPGASSGRSTPSPPPSRRTTDDSARNLPPESRGSCSTREDGEADTRRTSPPPPSAASATRTSPGTAAVAPTLAPASPPPGQQQAVPEPHSQLAPHSKPENASRARSAHEAGSSSSSSRPSKDWNNGGENLNSALWRVQAKNSFSAILDIVGRRSMSARSSCSSRSGTGPVSSDDQGAVRPSRPFPAAAAAAAGPWCGNHGSRNGSSSSSSSSSSSNGGLPSAAGSDEPPRGRYKSFSLREDSSLRSVPERPRVVDPLVARLAAAAAAAEFVGGALSTAVATRLSGSGVAGSGSGGGGVLDSRTQ